MRSWVRAPARPPLYRKLCIESWFSVFFVLFWWKIYFWPLFRIYTLSCFDCQVTVFFTSCYDWARTDGKGIEEIFNIYLLFRKFWELHGILWYQSSFPTFDGNRPDAPDYAEITRLAAELNNPCAAVWEGYHAGKRAGEGSFIEISAPSVVVRAVKRAEDGKGIVVRAYETEGKRTECRLRLFDTETTAVFAPFEIKTLRFFGKKAVEQDILELSLIHISEPTRPY